MDIYTIYRATNLINGKCYIGFDSNWPNRQKAHQRTANHNTGQYFHHAIRKYGFDNFIWDVLYQSLDQDHCLNTMEAQFILENKAFGDGYNCTKGGEGNLGWHESLSTEEKEARAKRKSAEHSNRSPEAKAATSKKISDVTLNRSTETKAAIVKKSAISKANKSPEAKAAESKKMSEAHLSRSTEAKAATSKKISEAHMNRSPEAKAATSKKMSEAQANRSPETKAAIKLHAEEKVVCCIVTRKEYNRIYAARKGF